MLAKSYLILNQFLNYLVATSCFFFFARHPKSALRLFFYYLHFFLVYLKSTYPWLTFGDGTINYTTNRAVFNWANRKGHWKFNEPIKTHNKWLKPKTSSCTNELWLVTSLRWLSGVSSWISFYIVWCRLEMATGISNSEKRRCFHSLLQTWLMVAASLAERSPPSWYNKSSERIDNRLLTDNKTTSAAFPTQIIYTAPEEFENVALFLRSGLPSTQIRHENRAFRKRSSNWRILKTLGLRFQ